MDISIIFFIYLSISPMSLIYSLCIRIYLSGPFIYLALFCFNSINHPERTLILKTPLQRLVLSKHQLENMIIGRNDVVPITDTIRILSGKEEEMTDERINNNRANERRRRVTKLKSEINNNIKTLSRKKTKIKFNLDKTKR